MNFVICFNKEAKENLIKNKFTYLHEIIIEGKKGYIFINNGKMQFENKEGLIFTDKLSF